MLKSSLRSLALVVTVLAFGTAHVAAAPPAPAEKPAAAPLVDYNGSYANSGGATLKIRNFVAGKGFDFQLTIKSDDDCNGVDYSERVTFSAPDKATNDGGDSFVLAKGAVQFEPSVEMIGMECARVIDSEFKKK